MKNNYLFTNQGQPLVVELLGIYDGYIWEKGWACMYPSNQIHTLRDWQCSDVVQVCGRVIVSGCLKWATLVARDSVRKNKAVLKRYQALGGKNVFLNKQNKFVLWIYISLKLNHSELQVLAKTNKNGFFRWNVLTHKVSDS